MALTQVTNSMLAFDGGPLGMRNRIINGAMQISQRTAVNTNVAVGTGTSGTFGPDRFYGYTGTASLWNTSQVTTGAYDFPYANRLQRIAGQTSTSPLYWRQIVETANCIDLSGQTVTLSFYATAGANYSGGSSAVGIFTGTGADQGTASLNTAVWTGLVLPLNSTFTPTTSRTRFTFTATLASVVQELAIGITYTGSGTAGANDYIDITGVQLESGTVATPFERQIYGTQLAMCQRYYYVGLNAVYGYPSPSTGGFALDQRYDFKTTMRTTPTVVTNYSVQSNITSIAPQTRVPDFFTDQIVSTAFTNTSWVMSYTASAEL